MSWEGWALSCCTLCALQIYCSYAQPTLLSAINTYKNANKTFTNVLKYVHECQHAAGNVSQETWGAGGGRWDEAVTEVIRGDSDRVIRGAQPRLRSWWWCHSRSFFKRSRPMDQPSFDPFKVSISSRSDDPIKPRETNIKFRSSQILHFIPSWCLVGRAPLLAVQKISITPQNAKPCAEPLTLIPHWAYKVLSHLQDSIAIIHV